jgi:hypothetical protein
MEMEDLVSEGRQDIQAPEPSLEESEPIPDQEKRGQRLFLWIGVVALIFLVIAIVVVAF